MSARPSGVRASAGVTCSRSALLWSSVVRTADTMPHVLPPAIAPMPTQANIKPIGTRLGVSMVGQGNQADAGARDERGSDATVEIPGIGMAESGDKQLERERDRPILEGGGVRCACRVARLLTRDGTRSQEQKHPGPPQRGPHDSPADCRRQRGPMTTNARDTRQHAPPSIKRGSHDRVPLPAR